MYKLSVIVSSIFTLCFAARSQVTWTIERLTYNSVSDLNTSIDVDNEGNAHIAHNSGTLETGLNLFYVTNKSGSWVTEEVEPSPGECRWHPSIKVDSEGKIHIALDVGFMGSTLVYVTNKSGEWAIETIAPSGIAPSLALDSKDFVHIVFKNYSTWELCYATNNTGNWVVSTIDTSRVGAYISIAIDTQRAVHITYSKSGDIWYITNETGDWVSIRVSSSSNDDVGSSIAVSDDGKAYLTWKEDLIGPYHLWYATNESGSFECKNFGLYTTHYVSPCIVVDKNGKAHIVYIGIPPEPLNYPELYYITNASGNWDTSRVTNNGFVDWGGYDGWFKIDNNGYGHIVWAAIPGEGEEIYYAKSNEPIVGIEEVASQSYPNFSIYPNPCHKSVSIQLSSIGTKHVIIGVYDISGRLMETIFSGILANGSHTFNWNRIDSKGKRVPPGVYFCQIIGENMSKTSKIILL